MPVARTGEFEFLRKRSCKKNCSWRTMSSEFPYQLIVIFILSRSANLKFIESRALQNCGAADALFVGL